MGNKVLLPIRLPCRRSDLERWLLLVLAGIFLAVPGFSRAQSFTLSKIVLSGEISPTGQPYQGFGGVYLNQQQNIVFDAYAGPLPYQNANGLYLASGGTISPVVLSGQTCPVTGGTYLNMTATGLNDSGQIAFAASMSGTGSDFGTLLLSGGTTTALALRGDPALGTPYYLTTLGGASLNNLGQAAFESFTDGPEDPLLFVPPDGIFKTAGSGATAIAFKGDPAPGTGSTFWYFDSGPSINNAGHVAFLGYTQDYMTSPDRGIYLESGGTTLPLVLPGDPAPGGGVYGDFLGPILNDVDQVAFDGSVAGSGGEGIFIESQAAGTMVAYRGQTAPGTGGGTFHSFLLLGIDDYGNVAFRADMDGGNNAQGIFFYDAGTGAITAVALMGDVAPGTGGKRFLYFIGGDMNDRGQIAFQSSMLDGSFGVFLASTPVPEPATLFLLASGLAGLALSRRRPR